MSTYLLLRSNKETGPYTLNELLKFGLKPYDLVWVNGKSAAWRYPSEIAELKSFAPVIEEQPYDRFYKKSTQEENSNSIKEEINTVRETTAQLQKIEIHEKQEANSKSQEGNGPKKQIYVSLPFNPPVKKVEAETKSVPSKQQITQDYENYMPSEKSVSEAEKIIRLEKRFSQPLEEIKDMYVQTLLDRKKRIARNSYFKKNIKNVAIIFLILALGVIMGFAFQNFNEKAEPLANVPSQPKSVIGETKVSDQQIVANEEELLIPNDGSPLEPPAKNDNHQGGEVMKQPANRSGQDQSSDIAEKNITEKPIVKQESLPKEIVKEPAEIAVNETPPAADKDPVSGERKRIMRTEKESDNSSPARNVSTVSLKENIWKLVTLKTNNYTTGPFGGIKDLLLTISNNSQYPIDKVEVEVRYIGMEQQVVKTQTMIFNDIAPGGQVRSEVPRTNRGMSVECVIKKINSRELAMAKSERLNQ